MSDPDPDERQKLESAIAALDAQRALLGDAVVESALGPMRERLAELTAAEQPVSTSAAQALKLVTILFTDIVGSTKMAERVDAEDMLELSSAALTQLAAVVQAHQGRVLRFTGDGLKAVFGAASVQEDDAERAVLCGLALQSAARSLGSSWSLRAPGLNFTIRVGIHSGPVALGGGVEGDATVMGGTVNLAARMEQAAPPGGVRISHDTFNQVRGLFDVEAQQTLSIKGVAEPVKTYVVRSARPKESRANLRGIEGVTTRMIGRDAELQLLQQEFARLIAQGSLQAVAVVAEAGVGKSRLLREFTTWRRLQQAAVHVFHGRATAQIQGQPFGLLRDILTRYLRIAADDSVEIARRRIEQAIVPLFVGDDGADLAEGHAHLLGHLIGIEWHDSRHLKGILDDPKQIRSRAQHAAAQLLRRISASDGAPILLELDDLHWADNESLDFLRYLIDVNQDVPMLVLGLCRSTLFERRPDWGRSDALFRCIELKPLDEAACSLLATELLNKLAEIPAALQEIITSGSQGNPFYMEELVKMLIDQGAILTGGADAVGWSVDAGRLRGARVPATLTGVLQARLDGLPASERLSLQQASVIGPVFWDSALAALDRQALQALPALVQRELALPSTDADQLVADDLREYAFKHQMLHQVTYATVLKRSRRELHGRLANWMAEQSGLRANHFLGVIADHFEQAGEDGQAAEFHARAAEYAKALFAHDAVLLHVDRALALIDKVMPEKQPALRWRLLDVRERTVDVQGDRRAQASDIGAMKELADVLADDGRRAHAAYRRGVMSLRTADWPSCEDAGRSGMMLAERAGKDELRLLSMRLLAMALTKQGDPVSGQAMVQLALREARSLDLRSVESFCLNALAVIASIRSDPVAVLEFARQDLQINRELANRRGEAVSLSGVGCGLMDLGQHAQAEAALQDSLRLLRANGDRVIEGATLCSLSTVALRQGDAVRALELARSAAEMALTVQARDMEAIALSKQGNACFALADLTAAASAYERSQQIASGIDEPVRHDAAAGLARVAQAAGSLEQAIALVDELSTHLAAADSLDGAEDPRWIELSCYRVLSATGDPRADQWLARARSNLQATAQTITDSSLRQSFLNEIPAHREILSI